MNWSAAEWRLVPPGVVTVTSTVPAARAGDTAVTSVALTTVKLVAAVVRKATEVAPVRLVPVIVTWVPPATGPAVGEMAVTVGAAAGLGELVGRRSVTGPARGGDGDIHRPRRPGRGHRGDLGGADHGETGGRRGPEGHRGGPGQVGAGDRHVGAAGHRSRRREIAVTVGAAA